MPLDLYLSHLTRIEDCDVSLYVSSKIQNLIVDDKDLSRRVFNKFLTALTKFNY